jgi:hypothetical protein
MDQFMLGHGFNSEIAQNKNMTGNFDNNNLSNDSPQVQRSQQISSSPTSTDSSLGKKVNFEKYFFQLFFIK